MNTFQKIFTLPLLAMLLVGGFVDVYMLSTPRGRLLFTLIGGASALYLATELLSTLGGAVLSAAGRVMLSSIVA